MKEKSQRSQRRKMNESCEKLFFVIELFFKQEKKKERRKKISFGSGTYSLSPSPLKLIAFL